MAICYLALGSNLRTPRRQLTSALQQLRTIPRSCIQAQSSIYHTKPMGIRAQPDFLNMVVALHTTLSPYCLFQYCKRIEAKQQRTRTQKWGSRTLDIDIILFDNHQIHLPKLTIPHPHFLKRDFVMIPLLEIAPSLCLPDQTPLAHYANPLQQTLVRQLSS